MYESRDPFSQEDLALTRARPSHVLQHTGAFHSLPSLLVRFGVSPDEVLAEVGLTPDALRPGRPLAPAAMMNRLLNVCVERTGCPHFALLVGQNVSLASLGTVGRLVASAETVAAALQDLATCFKFHNGAALIWLNDDREAVSVHYCIYDTRYESLSQLYAGVAVAACNVVRELSGPDWSPLEVYLPFRRPADIRPYRSRLRGPLIFDAGSLAIRFHRRWLARRVRTANPALHAVLDRRFKELDLPADGNLPAEVRRAIRCRLLTDKCGVDDVARLLGVHRRTLARRLRAHGVSHRGLVESVRFEMAKQLLRDTDLPVQEIAAHLRYGSVANFSTAFHHWSGEAPREFRARVGQPPSAMAASTSTTPTNRKTTPVSHGRAIVSRAKR